MNESDLFVALLMNSIELLVDVTEKEGLRSRCRVRRESQGVFREGWCKVAM